MNLKKIIADFPLVALFVIMSYFVLDEKIAFFVRRMWMASAPLLLFSADLPDVLFLLVCLTTAIAWIVFLYLVRKGIHNTHARFFQLIAISVPLANMLKAILKYAFGRTTTRFWLQHPHATEFHWFHGVGNYSGFPSGHMAVFTVLAAALWMYYPRHKTGYIVFMTILALALIATNYHFISDIIAGVYTGLFVHSATDYFLTSQRRSRKEQDTI